MKLLRFLMTLALLAVACTGKDPESLAFQAPAIEDVYAVAGFDRKQLIVVVRISSMDGIKECGICFGRDKLEKILSDNLQDNTFSVILSDLSYSTEYHYQAFIDGGRGPVYSETKTWRTADEIPPVPEILKTTRGLGADAGKVRFDCSIREFAKTEGVNALRCGVCISPSREEPTLEDAYEEADSFSSVGTYSVTMEGLILSTDYYCRPYTTIGTAVTFGEPVLVSIPSGADVVVTEGYEGLTHNKVTLKGTLNMDILGNETSFCGFEYNGRTDRTVLADSPNAEGSFSLTLTTLDPDTDYLFRAVAQVGAVKYEGEWISFKTPPIPSQWDEYVDLGLSVYWATCNLGADSPLEMGDFYAWGEIEPWNNNNFDWKGYKWCMGTMDSIFKYVLPDYSEQADGKTRLDLEDDAAHMALGGKWRMPTADEFQELIDNCVTVSKRIDDKPTYVVTSKVAGFKNNSIYLYGGYYWTSTLYPEDTRYAYMVIRESSRDALHLESNGRTSRLKIRPVRDK